MMDRLLKLTHVCPTFFKVPLFSFFGNVVGLHQDESLLHPKHTHAACKPSELNHYNYKRMMKCPIGVYVQAFILAMRFRLNGHLRHAWRPIQVSPSTTVRWGKMVRTGWIPPASQVEVTAEVVCLDQLISQITQPAALPGVPLVFAVRLKGRF